MDNQNEIYRQKYLKYKAKYLHLKNQGAGGFASALVKGATSLGKSIKKGSKKAYKKAKEAYKKAKKSKSDSDTESKSDSKSKSTQCTPDNSEELSEHLKMLIVHPEIKEAVQSNDVKNITKALETQHQKTVKSLKKCKGKSLDSNFVSALLGTSEQATSEQSENAGNGEPAEIISM